MGLDRTIFDLAAPGQPKESPLRYGKVSRIEDQLVGLPKLFVVGEGGDARRMSMLNTGEAIAVGDWVFWLDQAVPIGLGKPIMGTLTDVVPWGGASLTSWTKSATNTPGTSHSVTLPGTTVSGELLLAFLMWNANTTITGPGGGWTKLSGTGMSPGQTEVWAKLATGSDGASASFTSSTSNAGAFMVARITGNYNSLVLGTGLELAVTTGITGSSMDCPLVTPTWGAGDTLFVAAATFRGDNATATGYPADFTDGDYQVTTNGGGGGASVAGAVRELNAASLDPGVFGLSASQFGATYTVAVRAA